MLKRRVFLDQRIEQRLLLVYCPLHKRLHPGLGLPDLMFETQSCAAFSNEFGVELCDPGLELTTCLNFAGQLCSKLFGQGVKQASLAERCDFWADALIDTKLA